MNEFLGFYFILLYWLDVGNLEITDFGYAVVGFTIKFKKTCFYAIKAMCFSSLSSVSNDAKEIMEYLNSPLNLLSDLHGRVYRLPSLVITSLLLLLSQKLSLFSQLRHRLQVEIRVQVPEQSAGDANLWSVGEFLGSALHGLNGLLVDSDFVEARLDEATGDVLDLLARLDEEVVTWGHAYGNATARVAGPDVEAGVARTAVDGEEVEVSVEAGEDGVFGAVFPEVGGRRCKQVRTVSASVAEVCGWKTETDCSHFRELAYSTITVSTDYI